MPKLSLAEVRARLKEKEERKNNGGKKFTGPTAVFQFWDMPEDTSTTIRFLPDADKDNEWFWVKRETIELPFPGIKGGDTNREIKIKVPCMHMYKKSDPIIEETKDWWKGDEDTVAMARKYYKKVQYIYQGLVVQSSLKEEEVPENPIRRFVIGPAIHKIIDATLKDSEIEDWPTDYEMGLDFKISKTVKGKYPDYSSSAFARRTRSLSEDELDIIEKHGLFNLSDFLPKEPTKEQQELIFQMFEDSVNNELFDPIKYKDFYNQSGSNNSETEEEVVKETKRPALASRNTRVDEDEDEAVVETRKPVVQKREEVEEEEETATRPSKQSAQDILRKLQERKSRGE